MDEINPNKATFDDIDKFVRNLLGLGMKGTSQQVESNIAYFSAMTHVLLGRKTSESAGKLAYEIDQARSAVGKGLDKLTLAIANASNAADVAARDAVNQSKRMVFATWALVVVTGFLGLATAGLMFYTRELVMTPPTFIAPAGVK